MLAISNALKNQNAPARKIGQPPALGRGLTTGPQRAQKGAERRVARLEKTGPNAHFGAFFRSLEGTSTSRSMQETRLSKSDPVW